MIGVKWTSTWLFVSVVVVLLCSGLLLQVAASDNQHYLPSLQCYDPYGRPQVSFSAYFMCECKFGGLQLGHILCFSSLSASLPGSSFSSIASTKKTLLSETQRHKIRSHANPYNKQHTQTASFQWYILPVGRQHWLRAYNSHAIIKMQNTENRERTVSHPPRSFCATPQCRRQWNFDFDFVSINSLLTNHSTSRKVKII